MSRIEQIKEQFDVDLEQKRARLNKEQGLLDSWKKLPKVEGMERYLKVVSSRLQAMQNKELLPAETISQSIHEWQPMDELDDWSASDPYVRLFAHEQEDNFEQLLDNLTEVSKELEAVLKKDIPAITIRYQNAKTAYDQSVEAWNDYQELPESDKVAQYKGVLPRSSQEPVEGEYQLEEAAVKLKLSQLQKAIPLLAAVKKDHSQPIPCLLLNDLNVVVESDAESVSGDDEAIAATTLSPSPNDRKHSRSPSPVVSQTSSEGLECSQDSRAKRAKGQPPSRSPSIEAQQPVNFWGKTPSPVASDESMTDSELLRNI